MAEDVLDFFGANPQVDIPVPRRLSKITTPGFNVNVGSGSNYGINVTRNPELTDTFAGFKSLTGDTINQLRGLRADFAPGFGALTNSRVQAVRDARAKAISDLGANLRRRRVRGSSFGEDTLTRGNAEFAKLEADVRAQSKLEELGVNQELIQREYETGLQYVKTELAQINTEFEAAAGVAGGVAQSDAAIYAAQSKLAGLQAELTADAVSGLGSFVGDVLGGLGEKAGFSF